MKVLVTAASKHGGTEEMAYAIAETLRAGGISTTLLPLARVESLADYDAVVVGSAVYAGGWLNGAQQFLKAHREELKNRLVWLFSNGDPGPHDRRGREMSRLFSMADPMEHKVLPGSAEPGRLNFGGRATMNDPHVLSGHGCDFDEIRRWALHIGGAICAASTSSTEVR